MCDMFDEIVIMLKKMLLKNINYDINKIIVIYSSFHEHGNKQINSVQWDNV
jgi:hypothetical protein